MQVLHNSYLLVVLLLTAETCTVILIFHHTQYFKKYMLQMLCYLMKKLINLRTIVTATENKHKFSETLKVDLSYPT